MKRNTIDFEQYFLRNKALIAELVGHSNIRKNDTVIDIGAGSGAITSVLSRKVRRVIAIEPDSIAFAKLSSNLKTRENVEVICIDFLDFKLPDFPYKVFANIPFSLSSRIIKKLVSSDNPPKAIYLIVQKQFAQKLVLSSKHFHSALGVGIAPWWTARIRRPLKRTDFSPSPNVDSVLLELKLINDMNMPYRDISEFMKFVEDIYSAKRKFPKNIYKTKKPSEIPLDEWIEAFLNRKRLA